MNAAQAAIAAAVAKAAAQTNQGEATKGGGDYVPPKAGLTVATLIGYIEVGEQWHEVPGKPGWYSNDVQLVFELNGGANKAEEVDGKLIAKRITVTEKLSSNEKANYLKIFQAMNYDGQATHGAQLVGKHFLVMVHNTSKNGKTYASLKGPNGYDIRAPFVEKGDPLDPDTLVRHPVAAPARATSSEDKVFLWDFASKEMWDALFIDGEYEARKDDKTGKEYPAKSKNVIQNAIKGAKNFPGSPIQKILGDEAMSLEDSPLAGEEDAALAVPESEDIADQLGTDSAEDPLAGLL